MVLLAATLTSVRGFACPLIVVRAEAVITQFGRSHKLVPLFHGLVLELRTAVERVTRIPAEQTRVAGSREHFSRRSVVSCGRATSFGALSIVSRSFVLWLFASLPFDWLGCRWLSADVWSESCLELEELQ